MLDKKYNHQMVEKEKYEKWFNEGCFKSGDLNKKPFCIVIPPPNVTGKLHLGHAWDTTLQDVIIRYKKMNGYDTLWLPGMDHAGIATQAKVDAKLKEEKIKPRELSREKWLEYAWEWKEKYALSIREQWAKLGLSLDYSKERFTLDSGLNEAVKTVFIKLYEKGYIYRGERIINWDPLAQTALSNEEVIYKNVEGSLYYLKYWLEDKSTYLSIATTRPETLFGDVAVAVNPNDERYGMYIGKKVILPIANKLIPVIADDYADIEYGTGVVKITPAHDPNDFEVGNRHNLSRILCINLDGTMNEKAGIYEGLDRFVCREQLVIDLKNNDLLMKIEKISHSVGHSERTDVMVEPYLSKQWFVKMDVLAKQVLKKQRSDDKINFIPKRFEKILIHWMENIQDWCISRQLWWGHQIPAWYKDNQVYVGYEKPKDDGWIQDPDVLDTWFSSALWPFSTLGWPNNLDSRYFPNNVLVTGYDIIFFWVSRMIFQSIEFTGKIPFNEVLIHGLIRDKNGKKMSKSLGNGVDPMDVIDEYGADSLRYFLATSSSPGQDLRYDEVKVKSTWNFFNKLWNASRFVLLNIEDYKKEDLQFDQLTIFDKWIITKMNKIIDKIIKHMEKYEFNIVGNELYSFIWNDFCDWYIEFSKINMSNQTKNVLVLVLDDILKMLHPFAPYITEEINSKLFNTSTYIMLTSYPKYNKEIDFKKEVKEVEQIIDIIIKLRNIKSEFNIKNEIQLINNLYQKDIIDNNQHFFEKILKCKIVLEIKDLKTYECSFADGNIIIGYESLVESLNNDKLLKEKEALELSIIRRENLLNNTNYLNKAPKHIVDLDKEKLKEEKKSLENLIERLNKER